MKKTIAIICLMALVGCQHRKHTDENNLQESPLPYLIDGGVVRTIIIDSCEYILIGSVDTRTLTHKGNCKNSIHIYKENYVWHIDRFIPDTNKQSLTNK